MYRFDKDIPDNAENFESIINGGQSEMGQMYGEAVAMRATAYRELCKNFGDVPWMLSPHWPCLQPHTS